MELKYLLYGTSTGGLALFRGVTHHRTVTFTTDAKKALEYAKRDSRRFRSPPVIILVQNPDRYKPEPRQGLPDIYDIDFTKHPVDRNSKDVQVIQNPDLGMLCEAISQQES